MVSIVVQNASLTFPLIGTDSRFTRKIDNKISGNVQLVGGKIITGSGVNDGVAAIDDMSLTLKAGDRLGIYGHNGSGKTTLLRMLGGIYPPTEGSIQIDGHVTGMFSLKLGINPELSGLQNIKIKAMMYGLQVNEISPLIPSIIEFSELGEYIFMPVKTYSSGMMLRLQFSIATALQPDILLMDEWISSADREFRMKMNERLEKMFDIIPIVIIASHDRKRLDKWANRTIQLKNGKILYDKDLNSSNNKLVFKPDPLLIKHFNAYHNAANFVESLALIEIIWPKEIASYEHYYWKANVFSKANDYDKAYEAYKAAIAIKPSIAKLYDQCGRLLYRNEKYANAENYLKKALTLSHGGVGNISILKKCILRQDRKIDEIDTFLIGLLNSK